VLIANIFLYIDFNVYSEGVISSEFGNSLVGVIGCGNHILWWFPLSSLVGDLSHVSDNEWKIVGRSESGCWVDSGNDLNTREAIARFRRPHS